MADKQPISANLTFPNQLTYLWLELNLLLLVEVGVVGKLVDIAVVLLPVLEEEQDGADEQRQGHRHQNRLFGANLRRECGLKRVQYTQLKGDD